MIRFQKTGETSLPLKFLQGNPEIRTIFGFKFRKREGESNQILSITLLQFLTRSGIRFFNASERSMTLKRHGDRYQHSFMTPTFIPANLLVVAAQSFRCTFRLMQSLNNISRSEEFHERFHWSKRPFQKPTTGKPCHILKSIEKRG